MILIGIVCAVLLILGPIAAILIRITELGNTDTIFIVGVIFEIIGIVSFWFIIRKYYYQEEVEEESSPKKKGKNIRPEPEV